MENIRGRFAGAPPVYRILFALALFVFVSSFLLGGAQAVRVWGTPPPIWADAALLAKKLHGEGELAGAEREYRSASLIDRGSVDTRPGLTDIYRRTGNTEGMIRMHQDRVSRRPFEMQPRLDLGQALLEAGRVDESIQTLGMLRRLSPQYPSLLETLGIAYLEAARYAEAEGVFREGLKADPLSSNLHLGLGLALEQQGDLDEAEMAIERALRIDPGNEEALANQQRLQDRRVFGPGT